jgi:hypothetical protein
VNIRYSERSRRVGDAPQLTGSTSRRFQWRSYAGDISSRHGTMVLSRERLLTPTAGQLG